MTNQSIIDEPIVPKKAQINHIAPKEEHIEKKKKKPKEVQIEQVAFEETQVIENCECWD